MSQTTTTLIEQVWHTKASAPGSSSPVAVQESPKWETPKAHQKAQKKRIKRAAKAAKEAKMAAKAKVKAEAPKPSPSRAGQIPREELCKHCPIYAPHRVGMYQYNSPELPRKILIIQAKVLKGRATPEDIMLQSAFAAVHTHYTRVEAIQSNSAATNGDNETAQVSGSRRRERRFRNRDCTHFKCPITAPHRCGRIHVDSRNTPRKIKIITSRIANDRAAWDDYQLIREYNAVHNPEPKQDQDGDAASEEVQIVC